MKKTTVYLNEDELADLRRIAAASGRPQAELVREAVTEYVVNHAPKRVFLSAGIGASGRTGPVDVDAELSEIYEERRRRETDESDRRRGPSDRPGG